MKKEINQLSQVDALTIYTGMNLGKNGLNVKETVREYLRENKIGVLDALTAVEKRKSATPKSKSF